jgi:hypothetical protein
MVPAARLRDKNQTLSFLSGRCVLFKGLIYNVTLETRKLPRRAILFS